MRTEIRDLIEKVRGDIPGGDQLDGVISAMQARPYVQILEGLVFRDHEYSS